MNNPILPRLSFTLDEAVASTGLSRTRLYKAIADGSLRSIKTGRRRMLSAQALQAYVAQLEADSSPRAA